MKREHVRTVFTVLAIVLILLLVSLAIVIFSKPQRIPSPGTIKLKVPDFLNSFHSGRGIKGALDGDYNRSHLLYARIQLHAEINNTATCEEEILAPSGGYWRTGDDGTKHFYITDGVWGEGGTGFENLKNRLAYCFDNGFVPDLGLWIVNIDPLQDRLRQNPDLPIYGYNSAFFDDPESLEKLPKLPMANETGYTKFFTYLKKWMDADGYGDRWIMWEPCWEFNLWPWTNWGGAGCSRNWAIYPPYYEEAMTRIKEARDKVGANVLVAAHIIPWHEDEWVNRGRPRIDERGSTTGLNIHYLKGIQQCDVWGISLYSEWDISWNNNDVKTLGIHGYIDWLFDKIIKQCAEDPDIGSKFIGTFECNVPWQMRELRTDLLTEYAAEELDAMACDYIEYMYTKVSEYSSYMRLLGWWVPFGSENQWDSWRHCAAQNES